MSVADIAGFITLGIGLAGIAGWRIWLRIKFPGYFIVQRMARQQRREARRRSR